MKHHEAPKIISDLVSQVKLSSNLRKDTKCRLYNVNTVPYCIETLSYLGTKIWNLVPPEIKNSEHYKSFGKKIKNGSQIDAHVDSAKLLS